VSLSGGLSERDSFLGEAWPALFMSASAAMADFPRLRCRKDWDGELEFGDKERRLFPAIELGGNKYA